MPKFTSKQIEKEFRVKLYRYRCIFSHRFYWSCWNYEETEEIYIGWTLSEIVAKLQKARGNMQRDGGENEETRYIPNNTFKK
ncbi:hypothetical protein M2093_001196 [Breznakia sp. PH1-1]|nr:hypothetical protein [Breznakia sp. PH1-1]MDH6404180.1 hypothetical protein [Breznakia sp. PF1-11]MDH6411935.1 hypothetical protein [Breznakia sp. PFB1-11]MDH6414168.1 hypothetical protein [Breznakia sp. PFB1-14]MDH6418921.1 hypothetical protein [Breznakia sp. PFB1-12]